MIHSNESRIKFLKHLQLKVQNKLFKRGITTLLCEVGMNIQFVYVAIYNPEINSHIKDGHYVEFDKIKVYDIQYPFLEEFWKEVNFIITNESRQPTLNLTREEYENENKIKL